MNLFVIYLVAHIKHVKYSCFFFQTGRAGEIETSTHKIKHNKQANKTQTKAKQHNICRKECKALNA